MKTLALYAFALAAVLPIQSHAQVLHGTVAAHGDGDGIRIAICGDTLNCRLYGIDAPESNQPYGDSAAAKLAELVPLGAPCAIVMKDVDRYDRPDVVLFKADGSQVNTMLLAAGAAWWNKKYARKETSYEALERQARDERTGLWVNHNAIPPWEWRKGRRK